MFIQPLFPNLPTKISDFILISLVTLMYVTLCAEADMYVPAFPQMIEYFGVAEYKIQLILSLNFVGLCVAGLVIGPLSDAYGRRKVLFGGLLLFVISSIGCVLAETFPPMLFWRFIQGIAASVPMVVSAALFFDKYSLERASKLIAVANSVISASMAGAPIVGAWVSELFDWRANFIIILALGLISFLGVVLFIGETLPENKRKEFKPKSILKDYITISKSFTFMVYSTMAVMTFSAIVVYIANLSVIFINHLGMSLEVFSYYQASTMATFIVVSLFSVKLISKYGIDGTKDLGTVICLFGVIGLLIVSLIDESAVNLICLSMAFFAAGSAMIGGTFGAKAMEIFPHMNGTALAMMTAIRQLLASGLVILSEIFFDGTIVPVAILVFLSTVVPTLAYLMLRMKARVVN
jgi:DHA1 family bicyclomycin/chloramphenicol resistance-like MFS transporter